MTTDLAHGSEVSLEVVVRVARRVERRRRRRAHALFGVGVATLTMPTAAVMGGLQLGLAVSLLVIPMLIFAGFRGYHRAAEEAHRICSAAFAEPELSWVYTGGRLQAYRDGLADPDLWLVEIGSIERDRNAVFPAARVITGGQVASATPPDTER